MSPTLCWWCDSECGRLSYSMMADCQLSCWWGKEVGWLLSCPAGHRKNTRGGHTNTLELLIDIGPTTKYTLSAVQFKHMELVYNLQVCFHVFLILLGIQLYID